MHIYELCGSVGSFETNSARVQSFLERDDGYRIPRSSDGYDERPSDAAQLAEDWDTDIGHLPDLSTLDLGGGDDVNSTSSRQLPTGFLDPQNPMGPSTSSHDDLDLQAFVPSGIDDLSISDLFSEFPPFFASSPSPAADEQPPSQVTAASAPSAVDTERPSARLPRNMVPETSTAVVQQVQDALHHAIHLRQAEAAEKENDVYAAEPSTSVHGDIRLAVKRHEHIDKDKHIFSALLGYDASSQFRAYPATTFSGLDQRSREISPIGRRYNTAADIRDDPSASHNTVETDTYGKEPRSNAFAGRSAKTQPIQPGRKKAKLEAKRAYRSTLSIPTKFSDRILKPAGIVNTGLDCYASSLFQVLFRTDMWQNAMSSARLAIPDDPLLGFLSRLAGYFDLQSPMAYPEMRRVLADNGCLPSARSADDASRQMQDPNELHDMLCRQLDARLSAHPGSEANFGSMYSTRVETRFRCSTCETCHSTLTRSSREFSFLLHPHNPAVSDGELDVRRLLSAALPDDIHSARKCPDPACGGTKLTALPTITLSSGLLRLQVVWPSDNSPTSFGEHPTLRTDRRFNIPYKLHWNSSHDEALYGWDWLLSGIICRQGDLASAGHYIAIVPHGGMWWMIDDDKVFRIYSPTAAAFRDGAYPVMILYHMKAGTIQGSSKRPWDYTPDVPGSWDFCRTPTPSDSSDSEGEAAGDSNAFGDTEDAGFDFEFDPHEDLGPFEDLSDPVPQSDTRVKPGGDVHGGASSTTDKRPAIDEAIQDAQAVRTEYESGRAMPDADGLKTFPPRTAERIDLVSQHGVSLPVPQQPQRSPPKTPKSTTSSALRGSFAFANLRSGRAVPSGPLGDLHVQRSSNPGQGASNGAERSKLDADGPNSRTLDRPHSNGGSAVTDASNTTVGKSNASNRVAGVAGTQQTSGPTAAAQRSANVNHSGSFQLPRVTRLFDGNAPGSWQGLDIHQAEAFKHMATSFTAPENATTPRRMEPGSVSGSSTIRKGTSSEMEIASRTGDIPNDVGTDARPDAVSSGVPDYIQAARQMYMRPSPADKTQTFGNPVTPSARLAAVTGTDSNVQGSARPIRRLPPNSLAVRRGMNLHNASPLGTAVSSPLDGRRTSPTFAIRLGDPVVFEAGSNSKASTNLLRAGENGKVSTRLVQSPASATMPARIASPAGGGSGKSGNGIEVEDREHPSASIGTPTHRSAPAGTPVQVTAGAQVPGTSPSTSGVITPRRGASSGMNNAPRITPPAALYTPYSQGHNQWDVEQRLLDRAIQRFESIQWLANTAPRARPDPIMMLHARYFRNGPPMISDRFFELVTATRTADQLAGTPANNNGLVFGSVPSEAPGCLVPLDVLLDLRGRRKWWTTAFMDSVVQTAALRAAARRSKAVPTLMSVSDPTPEIVVVSHLFRFVERSFGNGRRSVMDAGGIGRGQEHMPFPALGNDASWRKKVVVAIVAVKDQTHVATFVLFGPWKLAIVFDGAGGSHDSVSLRGRWRHVLNERLKWEQRKELCTEDENRDWLCPENTPELRSALKWPKQDDGVNCGPLAVAAAILVAQGIRPSASVLGSGTKYGLEQGALLRDSILMLFLRSAAGKHPNGWLGSPIFEEETIEWDGRINGMTVQKRRDP